MSEPLRREEAPPRPNSPSLLSRLLTRRAFDDARNTDGESVGSIRTELWRSHVVEPITAIVPDWCDAWQRFEIQLRANDLEAATATLSQIKVFIDRLQRTWEGAADALGTWYREHAEPWNERYRGGGPFCLCWSQPVGELWLVRWNQAVPNNATSKCSPKRIPSSISTWVWPQIPEHSYDDPPFRVPLRALSLLELLGEEAEIPADALAGACSGLDAREKEQLAATAPVLAAIFLPVPGLFSAYFDKQPDAETMNHAEHLLYCSSVAVGDGLRDEFRRLRSERRTAEAQHAQITLGPPSGHSAGPIRERDIVSKPPALVFTNEATEPATPSTAINAQPAASEQSDRNEGKGKFSEAEKERIADVFRDVLKKVAVSPTNANRAGPQGEETGKKEPCPSTPDELPERARLAYLQYRQAVLALVEGDGRSESDVTDAAAYQYLKKAEVGNLPTEDTWKRNLRTARNALSQQKKKHRPKYGGRSAVRPEHFGDCDDD